MKFIYTGVDASMILTDRCLGADSKTQVDRIFFNTATKRIYAIRRCSAEDLQMQAEIVLLETRSGYMQVWSGRCKDAGGDQFLTDTYNLDCFYFFSSSGRAVWIDVQETQPCRTTCRSSYIEVKLQCGFRTTLSHEMRLDHQKLW